MSVECSVQRGEIAQSPRAKVQRKRRSHCEESGQRLSDVAISGEAARSLQFPSTVAKAMVDKLVTPGIASRRSGFRLRLSGYDGQDGGTGTMTNKTAQHLMPKAQRKNTLNVKH